MSISIIKNTPIHVVVLVSGAGDHVIGLDSLASSTQTPTSPIVAIASVLWSLTSDVVTVTRNGKVVGPFSKSGKKRIHDVDNLDADITVNIGVGGVMVLELKKMGGYGDTQHQNQSTGEIVVAPAVSPSPSLTPTVTPTPTPTRNASPSVTPSITPSVTRTPSITPSVTGTPSISVTPSITPSVTRSITPSVTPSFTPSITLTPSLTPSPTPSGVTGSAYLIIDPDDFTTGALVDTNPGIDAVYNTQPSDYSQTVVEDEYAPGYNKSVRQNWTALDCALGNQNLGMRFGVTSPFLTNDLPVSTNHVWIEVWQKLPVGWDQGEACGFNEEKFFQVFEDRPVSQSRWEITTGGGGLRTGNPSNGGASSLVNLAGNHPDYIAFSGTPNDGYVPWSAFADGAWHRFGIECQFGSSSVTHRVWAANRATNAMVLIHSETWDADTRGTVGFKEWNLWGAPMNQTPQATQERHGLPVLVYTSDPGWPTS